MERKANSCQPHLFEDWQDLKRCRRTIETAFSQISPFLPKKIHTVTDAGGEDDVITQLRYTVARKSLMNDYEFYKGNFFPFANDPNDYSLNQIWGNIENQPKAVI